MTQFPPGVSPTTPAPGGGSIAACTKCSAPENPMLRYCPTCGTDLGFPNVRAANSAENLRALDSRLAQSMENATARGVEDRLTELIQRVSQESHVVINMSTLVARQLLLDRNTLYAGYESLVGGSARTPALPELDSRRRMISGRLFGSYASEIRYGVLSLDGHGLANYGPIAVRIRNVAIADRVSFLQGNSYSIASQFEANTPTRLPAGLVCTWARRGDLAGVKLEPKLRVDESVAFSSLLVTSAGDRANDEFIEAHIYGSFNGFAVQSVAIAPVAHSRAERLDIQVILELDLARGQSAEFK